SCALSRHIGVGIKVNVRSRETQSPDTQVACVTRAKPRFCAESARKKFFAARGFPSIVALTAAGAGPFFARPERVFLSAGSPTPWRPVVTAIPTINQVV